ncbi:YlbF family regulator [Paenibacillus campi]|uniref:YlbF family regulator n=1 Tax=Paenibacillus campi TaxID=3106031 RepID=UPI002AFEBC73|nr:MULTISPECIES: YlbF family regulator [unclassified Paenibacillus]
MTNIYDKANELSSAIRNSKEVADITAAMQLIEADPESKRMLDDFRARQIEVQQRMMSGDMPNPEEMEQMEKLFEVLNLNLNIRRLFDAEQRLSTIIEDINKIITDSLSHLYGGPEQ